MSAVVAAVGQPADGDLGEADRNREFMRHALYRHFGDDYLFVGIDQGGRSDRA
jgi:hypothetical protein